MPGTNETILRFLLKTNARPMEVMSRFHPQGKTVLNRTVWRGKEARSCAVTKVKSRPYAAGSNEPLLFDIEVTYRPKGCITFVGNTKYDGWTAMLLDQATDGTLLDGHGKPLPKGQSPVYLPREVYGDVDFNELDFGEFIQEFQQEGIKHIPFDVVMTQLQSSSHISASIRSTFMAQRRHRPSVKIALTNGPSRTSTDAFGTRIINVDKSAPHLQRVILDHLTELVSGFIEGRYSIANMSSDEFVFVQLSGVLVDTTLNEHGQESRFDCLHEFLPDMFLDELATRLMANYLVNVSVVADGKALGLVLRRKEATEG